MNGFVYRNGANWLTVYEKLGIDWATSVFGFIAVALMPIPWVFKVYGPKIRAMSRFDAVH